MRCQAYKAAYYINTIPNHQVVQVKNLRTRPFLTPSI